MECADIKSQIAGDPALQPRSDLLAAHLRQCPYCREFAEDLKLQRLLRSMPLRETDTDFEQRVIKAALTAQTDVASPASVTSARDIPHPGWLAVAASLVVAVLVGLQWQGVQTVDEPADLLAAPLPVQMQQLEPIQVMLNSERALQEVTVIVDLPAHLALEGYGEKQRLQWTSNLNAGANKLVLPVQLREDVMNAIGRGELAMDEIVIRLEHEGLRKQFRVPVRQTAQSSASHQMIYVS